MKWPMSLAIQVDKLNQQQLKLVFSPNKCPTYHLKAKLLENN